MPYQLKLKIYTQENLPVGVVHVPEEAVNEVATPTIYCNEQDYKNILEIIKSYYKQEAVSE